MRLIFIFLFFTMVFLQGCYFAPEFPDKPEIAFESVDFKQFDVRDTFYVTVSFKDGDGDLGLGDQDQDGKFRFETIFTDATGDTITIGDHDTLPPFNCIDYKIMERDKHFVDTVLNLEDSTFYVNDTIMPVPDTVYRQINPNYYNYVMTVYRKRNGKFRKFNPSEDNINLDPDRFCFTGFKGRFKRLRENVNRPLEGEITYQFGSPLFLNYLRNDSLKVEVFIRDRALNKSNVVESRVFTLRELIESEE